MEFINDEIVKLMNCLKKGVSPYHTIKYSKDELDKAGFCELKAGESWNIMHGKGYYVDLFDTALYAFYIPLNYKNGMPLKAAACHTDWPGFHIKNMPESVEGKYQKLNVEVYGGPIFYSWLDRPLSIAGAACIKEDKNVVLKLVDFKRPMAIIPSLAIHYNREVNNSLSLNAQTDMQPLIDILPKELKNDGYFKRLLSEELGVKSEDILSYDLTLYNMEEAVIYGEHTQMLSAPRLDNLTSVQGCLSGIIKAAANDSFAAVMLFDHEEVGSQTKKGADSTLFEKMTQKAVVSLGGDFSDCYNSFMNGFLLSCDVSHAVHPNNPSISDQTNKVYMGDGVAFKQSSRQNYAYDVRILAKAEEICREYDILHKSFYNRSDIRGGGTLGSMLSAQLCMPAIDIGVSILSMHSSRELMAISDQRAFVEFVSKMLSIHD